VRIVVVGTGTDVGKTHVTVCLLAHARARGFRARGYKPVATGVIGRCEDAEQHARAAGAPYESPSFAYRRPVSPHLAAREQGTPIDLDVVQRRSDELSVGQEVLIVETAGGLFSPLSDRLTNADLATHLAPALVLLVAPDRLGVLHDVGATLDAARARALRVSAVVLSTPDPSDASTGDNASELDRIGRGPVLGVFPRSAAESAASQEITARVWAALALLESTQ